ncbi:MAG: carboxymuconolactone decarboxylase family protein, partial [Myxococcota bacterium]
LSPTELQTVLLAVSVDNGCSYCVAAHSTVAQMSNVPDHVVKSLRDNTTIDDPKLEALRLFAKSVVDKRGWLDESDLEAFFAAGYGKQQVLEVITAISLKTLSNYTNHIANTPLDEPFTKNTWKR